MKKESKKTKLDISVLEELRLVLEMVKLKKRPDLIARQLNRCSIEDLDVIIKDLSKTPKKKDSKDEE